MEQVKIDRITETQVNKIKKLDPLTCEYITEALNSQIKQTETLVNKIKKLDPVLYEHVMDRMKEIEEIGNAWCAASDETEEEILHQQYVLTESQIKSEMLELFKDGSTDCGEINLFEIYRRLLWDQ